MVKKILVMVLSVAVAAVLYIWGCRLIDSAMAQKPDYIGDLSSQPPFINTVCSW